MSDKKQGVEQLQILTLPHYAELLFGQGQSGWTQDMFGKSYFRRVHALPGMRFTRDDYTNCCRLLRDSFGVDVADGDYSPNSMAFCIDTEDMQSLRQQGLGTTSVAHLLGDIPSISIKPNLPEINNPIAVLRENLRLAVHNRHKWHDTLKNRLYTDNQRECEIDLPELFLKQLEQEIPPHSDDNVALTDCVTAMLAQLLPDVPIAIELQRDRSVRMTIAVKEADYEKLNAAIAAHETSPRTNVTSIMRKLEERDAGIKR